MIDFFGRKFRKNLVWHPKNDSNSPTYSVDWAKTTGEECPMGLDAQLVQSSLGITAFPGINTPGFEVPARDHAPVIDLDCPHHYEPSTTPGHGHLYINKAMSFDDMMEVLDVLVKHGIVQPGFRDAAKIRGWAAVRTPWTAK